jgi:hypothetical protein
MNFSPISGNGADNNRVNSSRYDNVTNSVAEALQAPAAVFFALRFICFKDLAQPAEYTLHEH